MDPGSVGREVKPKVRVVSMPIIMWFVVRSVMGIKVVRIIMMVSVNPVVPVTVSVVVPVTRLVMFLMTILVMVLVTRPRMAITCLRWRRPYDQKHYQKSGYCNLTDIFHCYSPFTRISRRGEQKGYGWVEKEKRSRSSAVFLGK